jgi:hypothetical protein
VIFYYFEEEEEEFSGSPRNDLWHETTGYRFTPCELFGLHFSYDFQLILHTPNLQQGCCFTAVIISAAHFVVLEEPMGMLLLVGTNFWQQ